MRGLFVTGTDTDVGKTYVSCQIVACLSSAGHRVAAYKPACSGSVRSIEGAEIWHDVEALYEACGGGIERAQLAPQCFRAAAAPPVAARQEGRVVDAGLLRSAVETFRQQADWLLVEGAGGWLAPLSNDDVVADLAADLGFPVLVVARAGLGTINHTLLTLESIRRRGLPVVGVVLNEAVPNASEARTDENAAQIVRWSGVKVLGLVTPGGKLPADADQFTDWFAEPHAIA